eukprot:SAG31_NODE_1530_length_7993_cov_7.079807_1_plen_75_part_00
MDSRACSWPNLTFGGSDDHGKLPSISDSRDFQSTRSHATSCPHGVLSVARRLSFAGVSLFGYPLLLRLLLVGFR